MRKFILSLAALLIGATSVSAQGLQPIPTDKDLRVGKLENGMTYYIRHNEKPKGQASFYILHDVGAIQENDDQQGLAHFLEHMAFNGTKNLPGKTMINYLEKIGVMFGYNLNAGTSWDYTEYMVKDVPVAREGAVDTALTILHDWSHFIALEPSEIDSERGVIMEELRTRDGAQWRSTIAMLKALYKDTKYAERNLIGYLDGLKSFDHKALEEFYHTWYRPDYQSIYVIGDIDVDAVEAKIKTLMSDIPAADPDAPAKEVIMVPGNEEPIISIFSDPEMQNSSVRMFAKRDALPREINNTDQYRHCHGREHGERPFAGDAHEARRSVPVGIHGRGSGIRQPDARSHDVRGSDRGRQAARRFPRYLHRDGAHAPSRLHAGRV